VRGGESEQRRRSSRRKWRGWESYHPCVSREAAMDACDNDFASKRRREAQVQQGFRSDDNGGKEGRNAAEAERPATPTTHQHRRRKQHHDTPPSYHYRHPDHLKYPPVFWLHGMDTTTLLRFFFYFFIFFKILGQWLCSSFFDFMMWRGVRPSIADLTTFGYSKNIKKWKKKIQLISLYIFGYPPTLTMYRNMVIFLEFFFLFVLVVFFSQEMVEFATKN